MVSPSHTGTSESMISLAYDRALLHNESNLKDYKTDPNICDHAMTVTVGMIKSTFFFSFFFSFFFLFFLKSLATSMLTTKTHGRCTVSPNWYPSRLSTRGSIMMGVYTLCNWIGIARGRQKE